MFGAIIGPNRTVTKKQSVAGNGMPALGIFSLLAGMGLAG